MSAVAVARHANPGFEFGHVGRDATVSRDPRMAMQADTFVADLPPIRHILESRPPIEPAIAGRLLAARFQRVYCSQCGRSFGPRDSGFSSCVSHMHLRAID